MSNNSNIKRKHEEIEEYSDEDTIDEGEHDCCSHDELEEDDNNKMKPIKTTTTTTTTTKNNNNNNNTNKTLSSLSSKIKKDAPKKQTTITQFFTKVEQLPQANITTKRTTTTIKKNNDNIVNESPFFKKIDNNNDNNNNNNGVKLKQVGNSPFFKKIIKSNDENGENDNDEDDDEEEDQFIDEIKPSKKKSNKKVKVNLTENKFSTLNISDENYKQEEETKSSKKEKLENIKIGAHVSIKCGYPSLIENAVKSGFKALAFFTNPPRTWRPTSIKDEDAIKFKESCEKHDFSPNYIMPHGSYFLNLGSPDIGNLEKSRKLFIHELNNCEKLGISLYNFHPGSHLGLISEKESIKIIADSINIAHHQTKNVITVIECTAGQGTNIGYKFEHLRDIIELVQDKSRVGVCLDCCHMFASGYNIKTKSNCQVIFKEFENVVGFKYLKGIHLNDKDD